MREENHIPNRVSAGQHHHEAVDADSDATCRRHAILKRKQEVFVDLLNLFTGLLFESRALNIRVVELGVTGGNLCPVDDQFVDVDDGIVTRVGQASGTSSFETWVTKIGSIDFSSTSFSNTCWETS